MKLTIVKMFPIDLKWRLIKLELNSKEWKEYYNINEEKLNEFLKKYKVKNAYYSVSRYLFYKKHPSYRFQNKILDTLYPIDIDKEHFHYKYEAYLMALSIKDYITKHLKSLKLLYFLDSGGGFHLLYENNHQRDKITKRLLNEGFIFDYKVSFDKKRVIRIPNTYNGNKGCLSYCLEKGKRPDDKGLFGDFPPSIISEMEVNKTKLPSHFFIKEISNSVYGVKDLYVPVIKQTKLNKQLLKKVQKEYKMGNLYMFKCQDGYQTIGIKCVDAKRLGKIYKRAKSKSLNVFEKYKQNWIYTSNIKSKSLKDSREYKSLKFIGILKQNQMENALISRPHVDFIKNYVNIDYKDMIGNRRNPIKIAEFKV